jgi:hypothetical protein
MNLFSLFHTKGVLYCFKKDFNGPGEFHGVVIEDWCKTKRKDSTFGTAPNQAKVEASFMDMACKAVKEGKLSIENATHVLLAQYGINGYFCGFRGQSEHHDAKLDHVRGGIYDSEMEELEGQEFLGMFIPQDKTTQLRFGMSTIPDNCERVATFHNYPDMDFNPVPWRRAYLEHQHPDSINFYCKVIETTKERIDINAELKQRDIDWNQANPSLPQKVIKEYNVWYHRSDPEQRRPAAPGNVGHNQVPKHCKELSRLVGCALPEKASGHAFRRLCITVLLGKCVNPIDIAKHTRQKSIQSAMPYAMQTGARKRNVSEALIPRGIAKNIRVEPTAAAGNQNMPTNIQSQIGPTHGDAGPTQGDAGTSSRTHQWEELQRLNFQKEVLEHEREMARIQRETVLIQAMSGWAPPPTMHHSMPAGPSRFNPYTNTSAPPMQPRPTNNRPLAPSGGEWVDDWDNGHHGGSGGGGYSRDWRGEHRGVRGGFHHDERGERYDHRGGWYPRDGRVEHHGGSGGWYPRDGRGEHHGGSGGWHPRDGRGEHHHGSGGGEYAHHGAGGGYPRDPGDGRGHHHQDHHWDNNRPW